MAPSTACYCWSHSFSLPSLCPLHSRSSPCRCWLSATPLAFQVFQPGVSGKIHVFSHQQAEWALWPTTQRQGAPDTAEFPCTKVLESHWQQKRNCTALQNIQCAGNVNPSHLTTYLFPTPIQRILRLLRDIISPEVSLCLPNSWQLVNQCPGFG